MCCKVMFKCDCCGLCCQNISNSSLYSDLDRGDGICKYFNIDSKLCNIYENRPIKCNINKTYELYFNKIMSRKDYDNLNHEACKKLKLGGK